MELVEPAELEDVDQAQDDDENSDGKKGGHRLRLRKVGCRLAVQRPLRKRPDCSTRLPRGVLRDAMPWRRWIEPLTRPFVFTFFRLTRGMTLGVRAVVVDAEGRVLLIEHTYVRGWHLPGGGVERGETAETAVVRELQEEAGVETIGRPRLISVHSNETVFRGDHVLIYRVDAWREVEATSRGEILARGFFALDALPEGITAGTRRRIAEALSDDEPEPHW
jgi:ADP-ribose pyrophosphatase YjhB (NUDIX family)